MRAVVAVLGHVPLGQQGGNLFRRQAVAGPHGGMAGHQRQQAFEELLPVGRSLLLGQVVHHSPEDRLGRALLAQDSRVARQQHAAAAEVLDLQAQFSS